MSGNSTKREALMRVASLVRPALATQDYIPALTHIKFDGEFATAFNDISAIVVRAGIDLQRCVPGDLLIRTLGLFGGDTVALTYDPVKSTLLLASGRSKLKLPTMHPKDFPFSVPTEQAPEVVITPAILKGIERCLLSVGNDPRHPAQMGVTLEVDGDKAVLYSTDNFTISRYATDSKIELPADVPVILPTFFCEQLVTLSKAFDGEKILVLLPGGLLVDFIDAHGNTEASLFSKTVVDLEPMEFRSIFAKHVKSKGVEAATIPDAFDAAFNRALLVLSNEMDKSTRVTVKNGTLQLHSTSALGDADDDFEFKGSGEVEFLIDPSLVVRASKVCTKVAFHGKAMMLTDDSGAFSHLIAHCAA